jgi:aspartate aminotransferase-like enzyme
VPIATGSATLVMELALVSTVRSSVLHLVNGAFSERWHAIGRSLGKASDRLDVPWGRAVDPDLVRRALRRTQGRPGGGYEAVTVVQNETSTGVINPVEEIAAAVREESDALVLVDAVSSLGGAPLETDAWGLDLVVTGSQKALAAPPGLVPFAVSARAEERAGRIEHRGFYTDLLRYLDKHRQGGPITTPAIPVAYALDRQLAKIEDEGIEARWARHAHLQQRVEAWIGGAYGRGGPGGDLGFSFAAAEGARSPTVSCLKPPDGLAPPDLLARLAARGFTVAGGYGAWKGSTFRIGHRGEVGESDLDALLAEIESVVQEA